MLTVTNTITEELVSRPAFDLTDARDELNLSEWPLFYLGQRIPANTKTLRYENTVYDAARNRTHNRKLEIVGSDAYGLPTMRDADVLLALLLIGKQRNDFRTPTVTFNRAELVEILGWGDSGRSYERIDEALKKWMTITLFFKNSWWDREDSQWRTEGFHLIEHVSISDRNGPRNQHELPLSSCTFSDVFFASLHQGNIKKLNLTEWFSLTVPAAKQMYRFLDKRFHATTSLQFDLQTFACGHVGFSRDYQPSKLKEKLKPAIAELVAIGFIEDLSIAERYTKVGHGEWQIHFTRQRTKQLEHEPLKGSKTERSHNRLLIKELTDRGVTAITARLMVEDASIGQDRIRHKIEILDWIKAKDPLEYPKRPGGWLVKAIKEDWQPPAGFQTRQEREDLAKANEAALAARVQMSTLAAAQESQRLADDRRREDESWQTVEAFLKDLSGDERETVIDAAISNSDGFTRDFAMKYRRNPTAGSGEIMYQMALKEHILPLVSNLAN